MKSKTLTQLVAAFLLFFVTTSAIAQKDSNAIALETLNLINLLASIDDGPNEAYEGEMTLKNGEIITGMFSLNNPDGDDYVVIHYTPNDCDSYYYTDIIDNVVFYDTDQTNSETIFKSENNSNYLLREVYNNGDDIIVYDSAISPLNNKLCGNVYIKKEEQLIDTWHFWSSGPKHDLIRYVRNKDGIRYKRKEFKSLDDLFEKI